MPGENAFSKIGDAAHRQDRGPEVLAIIDCLAILAALFVFLRLLSRRISKTTLWVCKINKSVRGVTDLISTKFDDYLVMLALIICGAAVGLAVRGEPHPWETHEDGTDFCDKPYSMEPESTCIHILITATTKPLSRR